MFHNNEKPPRSGRLECIACGDAGAVASKWLEPYRFYVLSYTDSGRGAGRFDSRSLEVVGRECFGIFLAPENVQLAEIQLCEMERLWAFLIGLSLMWGIWRV